MSLQTHTKCNKQHRNIFHVEDSKPISQPSENKDFTAIALPHHTQTLYRYPHNWRAGRFVYTDRRSTFLRLLACWEGRVGESAHGRVWHAETRRGEGNLRTCQSWTGSTCNPHNGTGSLWSRSALELSDFSDALIGSRAWDMGSLNVSTLKSNSY